MSTKKIGGRFLQQNEANRPVKKGPNNVTSAESFKKRMEQIRNDKVDPGWGSWRKMQTKGDNKKIMEKNRAYIAKKRDEYKKRLQAKQKK